MSFVNRGGSRYVFVEAPICTRPLENRVRSTGELTICALQITSRRPAFIAGDCRFVVPKNDVVGMVLFGTELAGRGSNVSPATPDAQLRIGLQRRTIR
jgi:hypothetical protein